MELLQWHYSFILLQEKQGESSYKGNMWRKGKVNKKIPITLLVSVFLVIIIIITSYFWSFEEWTKQTRADFGVLNILNKLGICIFVIFAFLKLLQFIFPKLNKFLTIDGKNDLSYIVPSSIILTLIIPLIIFRVSLTWFIWQYSVVSFIYIFGVIIICIKIFFNK